MGNSKQGISDQTPGQENTDIPVSRRDLLASTGLLASAMTLLTATGTSARDSTVSGLNAALTCARIRARLDGRPAYWLARGVKYALSDFDIIPLHGFAMLVGIACTQQSDGSQLFRIFEAPYAFDLTTGEVIASFKNPLTDAGVPIPHVQPLTLLYAVDTTGNLSIPSGDPRLGKVEFSGFVQARQSIGADALLEERFVTRLPPPAGSSEKPVLTELINYTGLASSLREDGLLFEAARQSIVVLRNGLDGPVTGGYPPMLLALYEGRKFLSFEDAVREAGEAQMEQTHPGFLEQLAKFA